MKVEAPFIHLIKLHTKYYLYDVNSKMIVNISNDLFDFFKSNENIKAEIEIPHKLEDEVRRLLKYDLFSKTDTGYEIEYPQGTNLEEILNNCMRIMTLQVTQNCNLRCKYCVYSGSYSNRVHSNKRMSFETAKSAITANGVLVSTDGLKKELEKDETFSIAYEYEMFKNFLCSCGKLDKIGSKLSVAYIEQLQGH